MNDPHARRCRIAHARRWRPNGRTRSTPCPDDAIPHPLDDLLAYADAVVTRPGGATVVDLRPAARAARE